MGVQQSKESARAEELIVLLAEARKQRNALGPAVEAERAAGIPPVPGTSQALRSALDQHCIMLAFEQLAVHNRKCERCAMLLMQ